MLKKGAYKLLFLGLILLSGLTSCSKYQSLLKSSDNDKKFEAAMKYYEKGDYFRAQALFEQLIGAYRATKRAEETYYYYASCHFQLKEYELAAFHYENFVKTYSNSKYTEECQFMLAYCYYLNSPGPTLDQENTLKAINNLQLFVNRYPKSSKIQQCNDLIDLLREKLQTKDFLNSKLYYDMGDYKAAIVAFKNLMKEYPNNKFREDCMFLITKSNYLLALNSIESKKEERLRAAIQSYYAFLDTYPQSKKLKEAEEIFSKAKEQLDIKQNTVK